MIAKRSGRVLSTACVFALVALTLMTWSLFDARPIPVIVAMSVGQLLGTASLLLFVRVAIADLRERLHRSTNGDASTARRAAGGNVQDRAGNGGDGRGTLL